MPVPPTRVVEITPVAPYDFALALDYLRSSASAVLERIVDDTLWRAIELDGRPALVAVRSVGAIAAPRLTVSVTAPDLDNALVVAATNYARRVLTLEVDPAPFLAIARADPALSAVVAPVANLRPVLMASPYESLVWAIVGQQINVTFARTLKLALTEICGRQLMVNGDAWPLTPRPADIAALAPEALRARQFSRQKIDYLIESARAVESGAIEFAHLAALPFDEAVATLTAVRGIGRWTAEYALMRGLGVRDSMPAGDLGLRAIMGQAYSLGRHATEAEVRERAERWAGWRGWAAFFWWRALQSGPRLVTQRRSAKNPVR